MALRLKWTKVRCCLGESAAINVCLVKLSLRSSDGKVLQVPKNVASMSKLIKGMIEEDDEGIISLEFFFQC